MGSAVRHPVLADTSALIAVAMTECWPAARSTLRVTTTSVCRTELRRHVRETSEYAPETSREHRLHHGSERTLTALEDDDSAFSSVTVVPAPSGPDAGEQSLRSELTEHPAAYEYVVLSDARARERLRRTRDREDQSVSVLPPTHLLYVLFDNDVVDRARFCAACADMMAGEGWTSAGAVHAMWDGIPVDCSGHVDDQFLP